MKRTPSPFWENVSVDGANHIICKLRFFSSKADSDIQITLSVWGFGEVFDYSTEWSICSPDGTKKTLEEAQIAAEDKFAEEFFADGKNIELVEFLNSLANNSSNS
jgi:hypothetical protein